MVMTTGLKKRKKTWLVTCRLSRPAESAGSAGNLVYTPYSAHPDPHPTQRTTSP